MGCHEPEGFMLVITLKPCSRRQTQSRRAVRVSVKWLNTYQMKCSGTSCRVQCASTMVRRLPSAANFVFVRRLYLCQFSARLHFQAFHVAAFRTSTGMETFVYSKVIATMFGSAASAISEETRKEQGS
jgi:hypothetical protein